MMARGRCSACHVAGRLGGMMRWGAPAAVLVLIPKCPVCLAGYIALATGVGLSFTEASFVRTGLIVVCGGALAYMAARRVWLSATRAGKA